MTNNRTRMVVPVDAQRVREIVREMMLTDPEFAIALRTVIRDEIAAEHDARQRNTCGNQPRGLTDRDCAVRGGVKGLGAHLGSFNYTPGSSE